MRGQTLESWDEYRSDEENDWMRREEKRGREYWEESEEEGEDRRKGREEKDRRNRR